DEPGERRAEVVHVGRGAFRERGLEQRDGAVRELGCAATDVGAQSSDESVGIHGSANLGSPRGPSNRERTLRPERAGRSRVGGPARSRRDWRLARASRATYNFGTVAQAARPYGAESRPEGVRSNDGAHI